MGDKTIKGKVQGFNIELINIDGAWLAKIPEINSYGFSGKSSKEALNDLLLFLGIYFENKKRKEDLNNINQEING